MERVNRIIRHPLWQSSMAAIHNLEKDRIFCGHDESHFMDVARLAYIESLRQNLEIPQEEIYAAALLHDIGRHLQYTKGVPHQEASAQIAAHILKDCDFLPGEQARILEAILSHRAQETSSQKNLAGLIYRADKKSRLCLFCLAQTECDWDEEKKNLFLEK